MTMSRANVCAPLILSLVTAVSSGGAQERPFFYEVPPVEAVHVVRGVRYADVDGGSLAMDVYRPRNATSPAPALILYGLYWPDANDRPVRESNDHVIRWARIAAANGIVAIVPDLRAEPGTGTAQAPTRAKAGDFERFMTHLSAHAREHGIDAERIVVLAASGSVAAALPAVQDPRMTALKAAVFYYGGAGASVTTFRSDLPTLWVRAGLDSPRMNAAIDTLVSRAVAQRAPITLINYATGHHAFEGRDDNAITRQIIRQTLDFVRQATMPDYQSALRRAPSEAGAG
jgi:dienelactone hydrolase